MCKNIRLLFSKNTTKSTSFCLKRPLASWDLQQNRSFQVEDPHVVAKEVVDHYLRRHIDIWLFFLMASISESIEIERGLSLEQTDKTCNEQLVIYQKQQLVTVKKSFILSCATWYIASCSSLTAYIFYNFYLQLQSKKFFKLNYQLKNIKFLKN